MGGIDDVFQNQRMKVKIVTDSFQIVQLVDAIEVDPADGGTVAKRLALIRRSQFPFLQMVGRVIDQVYIDRIDPFVTNMDHGAGRFASFVRGFP